MLIDINIIIGLFIGTLGYCLLYLGKGIQKYAIEGFKGEKQFEIKSKHSGIWIFGTILTSSNVFIQWAALLFAPINVIAPLEGLGLIILIIFSYYVLKEKIVKVQLIGIALIITGTILIPLFNPNTGSITIIDFDIPLFIILSLIILSSEVILILVSKSNQFKAAGLILGITAGTFMAFQTTSKRITAIPESTIILIFTIITFIYSILTLVMSQYAFTKAKANIVVPCFTSASIIIAILLGFVSLNEQLEFVQIIGIALIVAGVILLTRFIPNSTETNQND